MIIQAYLPHVGGAERQLAALAPLLRERGIDVHILTRRYPGLAAEEIIDGTPVYRLPIPGPKAVASLSFTLMALAQLWRLRPDVIHAHELLSPTTTAVAAKRLLKIPIVAKVLRGGKLGDVDKLQTRAGGMQRLASFRGNVDAFITISHEIDYELAELGIPRTKRPFIPNGVDTARFRPIAAPEKQNLRHKLALPAGPIAVFSGRLAPEKRVDQLIDLWPTIRTKHADALLLILGTGDEADKLMAQAGDGVRFAGRVDDVAPYLKAADLFLLPSATEGLSNALLEAMASGLPAIVTNVGGAPDLIEHQQSGWLIPPDQPIALQDGLQCLLGDSNMRTALGQKARRRVMQEYGLHAVADRLCALYETVRAGKPFHG